MTPSEAQRAAVERWEARNPEKMAAHRRLKARRRSYAERLMREAHKARYEALVVAQTGKDALPAKRYRAAMKALIAELPDDWARFRDQARKKVT